MGGVLPQKSTFVQYTCMSQLPTTLACAVLCSHTTCPCVCCPTTEASQEAACSLPARGSTIPSIGIGLFLDRSSRVIAGVGGTLWSLSRRHHRQGATGVCLFDLGCYDERHQRSAAISTSNCSSTSTGQRHWCRRHDWRGGPGHVH